MDKGLLDREEEFQHYLQKQQRAVDAVQANLEAETRKSRRSVTIKKET